jgi:hypothetical protein
MSVTSSESAPQAVSSRWIADVDKNTREVLRVQLTEYKGYQLIQLRVFYRDDRSDEMKPGKSGVSLRVEKLLELQAAIAKAIDAARSEGLL